CFEGQGAPAFWPWLQVLRGMVAHRDAATLRRQAPVGAAAIAHLVPELLPALDAPPTAVGPTSGPFELYDAVTRFLVAASHDQPLVVVIDDLHWADVGSLELLRLLGEHVAGSRLLLIGTTRDEGLAGPPAAPTPPGMTRVAGLRRLRLSGLDVGAVAQIVGERVGGGVPQDAVVTLHRRTDGNPFFLLQLLELAEASPRDHADHLAVPEAVPEGVGDLL